MNLCVGIMGPPEGWQPILQQEGIAHARVAGSFSPDDYSVVVVGDVLGDQELEMLRQYLYEGGAVLSSVKTYTKLARTSCKTSFVSFFLDDENSIFDSVGLIDIFDTCSFPRSANVLPEKSNSNAVYAGKLNDGFIIAVPFDPSIVSRDMRSRRKTFYAAERRLPFETVSTVSKGTVRLLVSRALEWLHHTRNLPYVHLWYYPHGARSIFCFRIDTDNGSREKIEALYLLGRRHQIPMSWFVDVKHQQSFLDVFAGMDGQEIGVHCYEHRVFNDLQSNRENLRHAKGILERAGFSPKGFVSPYGQWNEHLARAIAETGFDYSSEFGYDYDDLPCRAGGGVLQVPVHPICIGSLKRHSYSDEHMIRYFDFQIRRKLAAREPMMFYHHPNDGHHPVLEWLFEKMKNERIPAKTMSEYARWWKGRVAAVPVCSYSSKSIQFPHAVANHDVQIRITTADRTEALVPLAPQILMDTVRWESKPPVFHFPGDFKRQRRFNFRIPLIRIIDTLSSSVKGRKYL